jgi:hypothetical protein
VAEGARLESVYTFTGIGGSNPSLSASSSEIRKYRQNLKYPADFAIPLRYVCVASAKPYAAHRINAATNLTVASVWPAKVR